MHAGFALVCNIFSQRQRFTEKMENSEESFCDDKRKSWSGEEMQCFLSTIKEVNVISLMDGKKFRTTDIFRKVQELHKEQGFERTASQLLYKFKAMKKQFITARCYVKRGAGTAAKKKCAFYEELEEIFSYRPTVNQRGVDSISLPSVLDEDTSSYYPSDSEVSSVSKQSREPATKKCIKPTAGCSSWPPSPITSTKSSIPSAMPVGSFSIDYDNNDSFNSMPGSESCSSGICDSQQASIRKKLKTQSTTKRDSPRSGIKNIMNDFADKMMKSQNDLLAKMLMEQRQSDEKLMIQYHNMFMQQAQLLLAGLHSLGSSGPTNYAAFTSSMPPPNLIFPHTALHDPYRAQSSSWNNENESNTILEPSHVPQVHRKSEPSQNPHVAFTASPPGYSIRPTPMSRPSLISTTIVRGHRDTDQESPPIAITQPSTSTNTFSMPSKSETSRLVCTDSDDDTD